MSANDKVDAALHGNPVAIEIAKRAGELDMRRQEQIRLQKESIDRLLSKLSTAHKIIYDDEQWDCCMHPGGTARDALRSLLVRAVGE